MEDVATLVALACHLPGDEILDVILATQPERNVALVGGLGHELRERFPVARLYFPHDQRGCVDRGKYGDNRHSAASQLISRPSIQPSRKLLNQPPSAWS